MTIRLIDLICERHRALILDTRVWPVGYKPGDTTQCHECKATTKALPSCEVRPFPEFGRDRNEAIHESGHVVLALLLGFIVDYVALETSGRAGSTGHWSGRSTSSATVTSAAFAAVTVAGEAAVRYWLLVEGADSPANLLDAVFGGLLDADDFRAIDWPGSAAEAIHQADGLVAEHWPAIARVADALLAAGRLTGDEIAAIARIGCNA